MNGIISIYAFDELWNLSNIVRYGLMAIQHRGFQQYIVCTYNNDIECFSSENFDDIHKHDIRNVAIAATYSEPVEEAVIVEKEGNEKIAVICERPWNKVHEFIHELINALKSNRNRVEAFKNTINSFATYSSPSLAILTNREEVVIWRGSRLTPLILGGYGFDMVIVSSESVAIDILGGDVKRFLKPGEGLYISKHMLKTLSINHTNDCGLCFFELLYLARHDAIVDGVSVYEFRKALGEELTKHLNNDVDVVVGVPETALPYAIGFANKIGKPFEMAFIATGGRRRSMLFSDPFEKIVSIHLKMNPIRSSLEGKRVVIVDDSMVTGSTMKTVSQILRFRVGVKEIHLFIASPPLIKQCPFNIMKLDMSSLLAANLSQEHAKSYLEVDSLHWLSKDDVNRVAKMFGLRFCGRCFGLELFGGEEI